MANEAPGHTLNATALFHEAYLRLTDRALIRTEMPTVCDADKPIDWLQKAVAAGCSNSAPRKCDTDLDDLRDLDDFKKLIAALEKQAEKRA